MMFIIHHLFQYKSWKQSFNCVENAFGFEVLNNSIETEYSFDLDSDTWIWKIVQKLCCSISNIIKILIIKKTILTSSEVLFQ